MACGAAPVQPQANLVLTVAPGAAQIEIDGVNAASMLNQETVSLASRDALASSYVLAPGAYYTVNVKSPGHAAFSRKFFFRNGRKLDLKLGLARKGGKLPQGGYVEAFEAELSSSSTFSIHEDDGDASSGSYISQLQAAGQNDSTGRGAYQTFFAPEDGNYTLWARVSAGLNTEATVQLGFNGKHKKVWAKTAGYQWVAVDTARLKAGSNQITVGHDEAGARVDLFVITSKPLQDSDLDSFVTIIEKVESELPAPSAPDEGAKPDADAALTWSPPSLNNPRTIKVKAGGSAAIIKLDTHTDYVIEMPNEAVTRAVTLKGGRNVVLKGGEISIPWQGDNPTIASRTGLKIKGATGTVHIEGLLIHGKDLSEGIQIDAPQAIIQIQNVAIMGVHARDQRGFSDNHPDLIQTYGNAKEVRIDKFTGSTDYQGFFFKADYNGAHGKVKLSRVNIIGDATARYLLWFHVQKGAEKVSLEHVYVDVKEPNTRSLGRLVWPDQNGVYPNTAELSGSEPLTASWSAQMSPKIEGHVSAGRPPKGDFVRAEDVGLLYSSPGYQ